MRRPGGIRGQGRAFRSPDPPSDRGAPGARGSASSRSDLRPRRWSGAECGRQRRELRPAPRSAPRGARPRVRGSAQELAARTPSRAISTQDSLPAHSGDFFPLDVVPACRSQLERTADLRLYSSAQAAEDLDDVRAALGYEQVNLEAASYGTRVALLYLRRHSNRVRAAILRSVSPPWVKQPLHFAEDAQAAFDSLAADCRADPACATAFPDFEEEFQSVLTRLEGEGMMVELPSDDGAAPPRTIRLSGGAFAEKVRLMLYAPEFSSFFCPFSSTARPPATSALSPDVRDGDRRANRAGGEQWHVSLGHVRRRRWGGSRRRRRRILGPGRFWATGASDSSGLPASLWPQGELPDDFADPVRSDVPVLLISSTIDPITPPRWADEVAEGLGSSRHVRVPNAAHSPSSECVMAIERDFLVAASHEGLDIWLPVGDPTAAVPGGAAGLSLCRGPRGSSGRARPITPPRSSGCSRPGP